MTTKQKSSLKEELSVELLNRWNWGAFLLGWIWGLGNRTYIALLLFVPIVIRLTWSLSLGWGFLLFVVNILMLCVLGSRGNEWAWRNKDWKSIEHFKRVQRLWAIWGVACIGLLMAIALGHDFITRNIKTNMIENSEIIKMVVQDTSRNSQVIESIGSPIEYAGSPKENSVFVKLSSDSYIDIYMKIVKMIFGYILEAIP